MYDTIMNFLIVLVVIVCNMVQYDQFVNGYNSNGEVKCIEKERKALLTFKKGLPMDLGGVLSSWVHDDKECCQWNGVRCSNTTGHVIALLLPGDSIYGSYYVGGNISSALFELHHLRALDLSHNDFRRNTIPEFIYSMTQLQDLKLSRSNLSGVVPPQLGNLTNLKTLDLSFNSYLRSYNLSWLTRLSLLSELDLSYINLSDANWAQRTLNLHSLRKLSLRGCGLVDVELSSFSTLSSLSILNLSENSLTYSTVDWLLNSTKNLRTLHLWGNRLKSLPSSIWQHSLLEGLDVSFNYLEGTITESNFTNLRNLKLLGLSFNLLTLDISPGWTPPFQLDDIRLAGCNLGPVFPVWLHKQSNLSMIDLSSNGISGEVPKWLWSLTPALTHLNLSHNHFSGNVLDFSSKSIKMIDVSYNNFSGPIPLLPPTTIFFQLSQNMFSGSIQSICTFQDAFLIDLSNNKLSGELPNCWQNMRFLLSLNLANNSFSGEIPNELGSLSGLRTLHLSNNNLSGELPSSLKNCKSLYLIDIRGNKLTGHIPAWIGEYHEAMRYLIFCDNRFEGSIPSEICNLTRVQVLDLSINNLSAEIPRCFDNFALLVDMGTPNTNLIGLITVRDSSYYALYYIEYAFVQWKGKELEYRRTLQFLKLVDLSSNRLVGNIPRSFFSLRGLISLNLSRNSLTGNINPDIGQMGMLEVLDLSSNRLSGAIPIGMTRLQFLGVLDLANNKFSGKIPTGSQLQTFNASSYAGNIGLCGSPLSLCTKDSPNPSTDNDDKDDDGILSISFLKETGVSIILGFVLGFWGAVGTLIVKISWRRAFFDFWGAVGDWLYVTTTIFWTKFRRN